MKIKRIVLSTERFSQQCTVSYSHLDMTEFRQDAEAVVLNKKIYVIGGRDFKGERVLDSIECFDVSEGEWSRLTSVPVPREGFRCVTCRVSRDHLAPMKLK